MWNVSFVHINLTASAYTLGETNHSFGQNLNRFILNCNVHCKYYCVLCSILQAHAPNSCVIIVGSFLDCLGPDGRSRLNHLDDLINELYASDLRYPRSPNVHAIAVSGKTRENIPKLKQLIFKLAKSVQVKVDFLSKENLIGKMVSYLFSLFNTVFLYSLYWNTN